MVYLVHKLREELNNDNERKIRKQITKIKRKI